MDFNVVAAGGGPEISVGANYSIFSDAVGFYTDESKTFRDFSNSVVNYTSAGVSLFIGYEVAYLTFYGFGEGARLISVGGWSVGTAGIGGSSVSGPVIGKPSPDMDNVRVPGSNIARIPYSRTATQDFKHQVRFSTGSDELSSIEVDLLKSVIGTAIASTR